MAKPAKKKTLQPDIARRRAVRRKKLQSPEIGQTTEYDAARTLDQPPMAGRLPIGLKPRSSPEVLDRLWTIIESRKGADPEVSHSARLLAKGTVRVAQKFGEEAVECLLEAVAGNRTGLIGESADVLYHLLVTWVHAGVHPNEVWQELQRRERVSYLTEGADVPLKRLLASVQIGTSKIP